MSAKALFKEMEEHKVKIQGPHFLMSSENPKFPEKNELGIDHQTVLSHLQGAGYDAHEVTHHAGKMEKSIVVYGVDSGQSEKLHSLAAKLGQDSSISSDGENHEMRFHHGEMAGKKVAGKGTKHHTEKPSDFFTTLPGGAHHFTHSFDFSKAV